MFHMAFPQEMSKKMFAQKKTREVLAPVFQYTPPVLRELKEWYIEFYAFDPARNELRRKRIKINRLKNLRVRRQYAKDMINRISRKLSEGWNPWIDKDESSLYLLDEVFSRYELAIDKMFSIGSYRKDTYAGYKSYLKLFREYIRDVDTIHYLYQLDRSYIIRYLDYVFIDKGCSGQTRNNHLTWLQVFCGWCIDKGFMKVRATDGVSRIDKRLLKKQRKLIPLPLVKKISDWLNVHDRRFLFVCQLLYNCFIRPIELTRAKVDWFSVKNSTITIPADCSKNKETLVVTVPKKVLLLAIDLGYLSSPSDYYVFGDKLMPGKTPIDTKIFRDHWRHVREALRFSKEHQFYSLKDTGITEMLDNHVTSIAVRDQARHSSLEITEVYTRHLQQANKVLVDWEGSL